MSAGKLLPAAALLTFVVVVAGAFVRLSDAGLGCPDWPGCYGQLLGVGDEAAAAASHPESPYDSKKAWIEVAHRYIAALLGLLVVMAVAAEWLAARRLRLLPLVALIMAQALLGMLTVTEKLKPLIVTAHLLGGMLILAVIVAAIARRPLSVSAPAAVRARLRRWWAAAFIVLFIQIALGGWVSSNYAGLACPDFPLCQGGWLPPQVDFSGFSLQRDLHVTAAGEPISAAALATIHWSHRLMALILALLFAALALLLVKSGARREGRGLIIFLFLQIALGIINVVWQLPLAAAVAHNAVAALLVASMAVLGVKLSRR